MNHSTAPGTANSDWAKALFVSLLVHIVLIGLWIAAILYELFSGRVDQALEEKIPEEKYVTIPVEVVEALEQRAEVEQPEPLPPQKQFETTRASQETTEPVTSDRYFGERNTAAASSGKVADEGLEVPSQEGREALDPSDRELADSDFADGESEGAPGLPGEPVPPSLVQPSPPSPDTPSEDLMAAEPSEPSEATEPPETTPLLEPVESEETAEPGEPPVPSEAERKEMAQAREEEFMAMEGNILVPEQQEGEELEEELERFEEQLEETNEELAMVDPVEEPTPEEPEVEETPPEPKPTTPPQQTASVAPGNQGLQGGFDREARKTKLTGTIRRRGENSLEVEDTVKGRYFAEVNKQIEKSWQRECILRREHILQGVLSVRFSVDNDGMVTGFAFASRIAGGAIQEGFTMRAIQKAKIPEMPDEIKEELEGSELEMNLTFFF